MENHFSIFFLDDDSRFVMTLKVCFNAVRSFLLKKAGTLHGDIMYQMVLGNCGDISMNILTGA